MTFPHMAETNIVQFQPLTTSAGYGLYAWTLGPLVISNTPVHLPCIILHFAYDVRIW
jgi:hypothetical protein